MYNLSLIQDPGISRDQLREQIKQQVQQQVQQATEARQAAAKRGRPPGRLLCWSTSRQPAVRWDRWASQ